MSALQLCEIGAEARRLVEKGEPAKALALLASLPGVHDNPDLASVRAKALRAAVPSWHIAMMNDQPRNEAFRAAIRAAGVEGKNVLEIGTGAGLLAMMIAGESPASLTTCEVSSVLHAMAGQLVEQNGFKDRIKLVNKLSNELQVGVDLAEKVDVVIAEIVDSVLVGEGVLPSLRDARERLLKAGGRIIPGAMRLYAAPFMSEYLHRESFVQPVSGFDLSAFNQFATRVHRPVVFGLYPHAMLGPSVKLFELDLMKDDLKPFSGEAEIAIAADGILHGYVLWFELELVPGVVVSNQPTDIHSHWGQSISMLEAEGEVVAGDTRTVAFEVTDSNFLLKA